MNTNLPKLLFVGAFPPRENKVYGGNVTDCRILLNSSFTKRFNLDLLDSTQITNPPPNFFIRLHFAIKRFFLFFKKIYKNKPDAVLVFCSTGVSLVEKSLMIWCARLFGIPGVIFPRGGALIDACNKSKFTSLWVKLLLRGACKFFCQGSAWQRFAINVCGFEKNNAPIVPNWTASNELLQVGKERIFSAKDTRAKLLFVGWVEIGKGILDLIEAAALLVSKGETSFLITIAGDGHARTEVEKLISIYHLENYFNLLGWVDPNELVPLYAMNEIFILPSYAEGLPNSMIEAMAAGLGIVVTPVGNITDVIHDEINGIIIEAKNTEMIANKIYDLINDRKKLIKIASNAHNTACKNFAVEPVIDLIEKEILSLVKNVTKS